MAREPLRLILKAAAMLAATVTVLAVPLCGQEPAPPVFRSTTRLVQLNVVVLDKQNRPVKDLGPQDFQVLDNGLEQRLTHFSRASERAAGTTQSSSPLVITNRPQGQAETSSTMTVILLDEVVDQNIFVPQALRQLIQSARLQILKFLGTLKPGDQVALYALRQEGVVVVHDFTDDPAVLIEAGKKLGSGLLAGNAVGSATLADTESAQAIRGWLAGSSRRNTEVDLNMDLRRRLSGYAFQAIANHLRGIPGRKNVIWISATFPSMVVGLNPDLMAGERDTILPNPWGSSQPVFADTESYYNQLRDFARSLSNANISVYSIDPRGLIGTLALTGGRADRNSSSGPPPPVMPTIGPFFIGPWATMDLVASETGGRAFYDQNGLDHILREVVDETRVPYLLGYYPGDRTWDGKYHKIQVEVKRDGLKVLCRKGYFAIDEPLGDRRTSLREFARSPLDAAGIGLTLNVPSNPLDVGLEEVVLKLDPQNIHFEQGGGRWRAKLNVVFTGLSKDGRALGGDQDYLELALYPDSYSEAESLGWFYSKKVFVNPGAERFRIVVRDLATGAVGSVSVPVRQYGRR